MKAPMEIGTDLHAYFRAVADDRPAPGALEAVLARTTVMRPRRAPLAWLDGVSDRLIRSADLRRVGLVVAVGLLIALALLALLTSGSSRTPHAGFLAFSHDGTVYAVGPDGGTPVAILPAGGGRLYMVPTAAWSADGQYLAVDQDRDGSVEPTDLPESSVLIVDWRTGSARDIGPGWFVGWAGNEAIVGRETQVNAIDVVTAASRSISLIADGPLALSPDGRWLAQTGRGGLRRIDTRTGERVTLVENPSELVDLAAWSPDSSWITVARTLGSGCHMCVGPLLRIAVDGTRMEPISPEGENAWRSSWAPSGDWIAYQGRDGIVVERPDGSERRIIVAGQNPTWTPDSRRVRFLGATALDDTYTRYPLFEIELSTGEVRRLDDGRGADGFAGQSLPEGIDAPRLEWSPSTIHGVSATGG